jgi:N-hydroxyarylamine O-acetyltransferase
MHIDHYLRRIGLTAPPRADLQGLAALHRAHLLALTFENIDVQLGRPLGTGIAAAYDKIVERGRGGWCYEMNGVFGWALGELGFAVTRLSGTVRREILGDRLNGNHLVLRVDLPEGRFLADVGFGDGPRDPIALVPGVFRCAGFDFELIRVDAEWWRLINHPRGGAPSFDVTLAPADEALLAAKCRYLQTSPESGFVQNLVLQRHVPHGLETLRGRVWRTLREDRIEERLIESADQLVDVAREVFALDMPEVAALWPRIRGRHEQVMAEKAMP